MRELTESKWAVISERGCEASALAYEEARTLERRLRREKVHGLCIVTAAAAQRMKERVPVEVR